MINNLDDLDFGPLNTYISELFEEAGWNSMFASTIIECFNALCNANLDCYRSNMSILDIRKNDPENYKGIANFEWKARSVGEIRVGSKAKINQIIAERFGSTPMVTLDIQTYDDIVYSVGEMLDRISIEYIKCVYFSQRGETEKRVRSKNWAARVGGYLKLKLQETKTKGYYECVDEQRTYDLGGI